MDTRHRNLTKDDVRDAFTQANESGTALLSFTDHDFRNMADHIEKIWNMINEVNSEFDDVSFEYATGVNGMRKVLNMSNISPPDLSIEMMRDNEASILTVTADNEIFGNQPYLAIKTKSNKYYWENFDQLPGKWSYTFDFHTLPLDSIKTIGVAANSPTGVTEVVNYEPSTDQIDKETWHQNAGVNQ
jgi:histidinol phosphatase-like PHP family hydrolase